MSEVKFKPGDRVRTRVVRGVADPVNDQWQTATVISCGEKRVFVTYTWNDDALDGAGVVEEEAWRIKDTELVPVYPELWINVDADGSGSRWASREKADRNAFDDRVALIHLASDGTLTLHPCGPCGVSGDVRGAA